MEGIVHLGYPLYFITIIGFWKVLGAITLLAPGFPRLKEWAYAGMQARMKNPAMIYPDAMQAIQALQAATQKRRRAVNDTRPCPPACEPDQRL